MKCTSVLMVFALSACFRVHAEEEVNPFEEAKREIPRNVRVQVEFIDMSHTVMTRLMMENPQKTMDATPLRMKVHELVEKGEAKVLETMMDTVRDGLKSTTESIQEFIYPTEYEPPSLQATSGESPQYRDHPAIPSCFETRNLGSTMEIEPAIQADKSEVVVRFVPEMTIFGKMSVWHEGKDSDGNAFKLQMPIFNTLRVNTTITCKSGQYHLIGALSPKNSEGEIDFERKLMVFLKCDVLEVK